MKTTAEIVAEVTEKHGTFGPEEPDEIWDGIRDRGHFDREGTPISMRQWLALRAWDSEHGGYVRVAETIIGPYWISTVWIGLDHGWGDRPLIFETMVFKNKESDLDCERYSTEAEALAGHQEMVEKVRLIHQATTPGPA